MAAVVAVVAGKARGVPNMADGFLGRWSRRKQDVLAGKVVAEPPAPAPTPEGDAALASDPSRQPLALPATSQSTLRGPQGPAAVDTEGTSASAASAPVAPPEPPTLADAQALTQDSDFAPFVSRAVSPEVRNMAMKKLFADPHFNVMDGLDIYIGDYSQPDPLPAQTLRQMASAHALGFFDHEKDAADGGALAADQQASAPAEDAVSEDPIAPVNGQPRDGAETKAHQDVAQSQVCNAVPSEPSCHSLSQPGLVTPSESEAVARPASHTDHDHDAHLRLQPDDAPQRKGAGRGTA